MAGLFDSLVCTAAELIVKMKIKCRRTMAYFSYGIEHMRFVPSKRLTTMGVDKEGHCYYNEDFVQSLANDLAKLLGVSVHEVMHLLLDHPNRGKNLTASINGFGVFNLVADMYINNILGMNNIPLPEGCIMPVNDEYTMYGITIQGISTKSVEEMYWEFVAQIEKKLQEQPQSGSSESGENGIEVSLPGYEQDDKKAQAGGEHTWNGEGDAEQDKPQDEGDAPSQSGAEGQQTEGQPKKINWKQVASQAYNYAKMIGSEPLGVGRAYGEIFKSKVNWRAIIRNVVSSALPYEFTYSRPNKRYIWADIFQPSFTGEKIEVICSIDTSGSMNDDDITAVMSEINGLARSFAMVDFRVITHDYEVHQDEKFSSMNMRKFRQFIPKGGGGTSHKLLYNHIASKRYAQNVKLLISFTDGYSDFPEKKPGIQTVFVLTRGHCPKEQMPSWANKVVVIDE